MLFEDRWDAGRRLAFRLKQEGVSADLVVAIPRGGVPVGRAIADALSIPLDVREAQKLGAPGNPELAIGAVAAGGSLWLNDSLIRRPGVEKDYVR